MEIKDKIEKYNLQQKINEIDKKYAKERENNLLVYWYVFTSALVAIWVTLLYNIWLREELYILTSIVGGLSVYSLLICFFIFREQDREKKEV